MDALMRAQRSRQGQPGAMSAGGGIPDLPGLSASRLVAEGGGGQATPGLLARPGGYAGIPRPTRFLPPGDQQSALYQLLHRMLPKAPTAPGTTRGTTPTAPGGGVGAGGPGTAPASVTSGGAAGGGFFPTAPGPVTPGAANTPTTFSAAGPSPNLADPGSFNDQVQQAIKDFVDSLNAPAGSAI
jgi:hypothetical protein